MDAPRPTSDDLAAEETSGAGSTDAAAAKSSAASTGELAADVQGVERAKVIITSDDFGYDAKEYARLYLALVARVTDLEAHATRVTDLWQAAEAQVAALTQERDGARVALADKVQRKRAAEAALAEARQALEYIANWGYDVMVRGGEDGPIQQAARRALAATEEEA